jgi:hypothetical protein
VIVYRDYSNGVDDPINLFIGPEPVGWDSPSICAAYRGAVITQVGTRSIAGVPGLTLTQIVAHSQGSDHIDICAYYWRGIDGPLNDRGIHLLRGKWAILAGSSSFRVQMCTEAKRRSDIDPASERLSAFASLVDPQVQRILRKPVKAGIQRNISSSSDESAQHGRSASGH